MNPDTTFLRFGPPGTGKTHDLLNTVEQLLEDGFKPDEIAFLAFTRKAAREAKERAQDKLSIHPENLPFFRTIHSFTFIQLGLQKNQVMGIKDYITICQQLGLSITFKGVMEDGTISGLSKGDRLFFMENMARAQKIDLKEYWERTNEDIYFYELERLRNTLLAYKKSLDKLDYTDIIYRFIETPNIPELRALIVDEAQDLTPLQWDVVELLSSKVEETYIAGDDDQAIFRWAGADIDRFINCPGSRVILDQSYRVPVKVQAVAHEIAEKISIRVKKEWKPRAAEGVVEYVTALEHVDMSKGTWLLLGRNVFLLQQFNDHCMREGFVFDSQLGSPIRGEAFGAIKHWEELRKGMTVRGSDVKQIYEYMSTKVGVAYGFKTKIEKELDNAKLTMTELQKNFGLITDKVWHEALDKLSAEEREYFIAALRRGEKLLRAPRIKISTIHGVKGGEAENVLICTDMADRTWHEYQANPDDEHRVWYVAVTRAKESLFILQPTTNRNYDI